MKQHYFISDGDCLIGQSRGCSKAHQNWLLASWRFVRSPLMALLLWVFGSDINAQVSNYSFSQSIGAYTPLTGGTVVASFEGSLGVLSMDDVIYNLPTGTIPFGFVFDGQIYTGMNISSNGFITFGVTPPAGNSYVPISATTTYAGAISPFGRDLQGGWVFAADRTNGSNLLTNASDIGLAQVGDFISGTGIPAGATITAIDGNTITMSANATSTGTAGGVQVGGSWSNIRYQTLGSAPNRIFVVEFNNFKRFGATLTTSQHMKLNFQIRLNESDNSIDVVYGDCSPGLTTFTTVNQVGLRGANNTFPTNVNNRLNTKGVNDNWLNTLAGTSNVSGLLFNNVAPANEIPLGLTYRWSPPSCLTASNVLVSDISSTSAEISWVSTGSNQIDYVIEYGLAGFTQGTGILLNNQSSPTTLSSLTPSTNYQFYIKSNCGAEGESVWAGPFAFRTLCDPALITETTNATICGQGSATLSAVASDGVVNWFSSPTSNTPLFQGSTFNTPVITETTSFWVAAVTSGSLTSGLGRIQPTVNEFTTSSNWGLLFTATSDFTLNTVDVYLTGTTAGTLTVNLTNETGGILQTFQIATPPGSSTTPVLFTVPVNFAITPGNYRLIAATGSPSMIREFSGATFPYDLAGVGQITGGFLTSPNTTYYWFYNWSITSGCVGPRVEVIATVTEADEIIVDSSDDVICLGQSSELTVSSVNENYEYVWEPGGLTGAVQLVSPQETTTYTVTALDANTGCLTTETITITVNPVPGAILINGGSSTAEVCLDQTVALVAVGGSIPGQVVFEDDFNGATSNWTTVNNSTGGVNPAISAWTLQASGVTPPTPAISSPDNSQFYISNSDAAGSGTLTETILTSPAFSTIGVSEANLSFQHFFRQFLESSTAVVEISSDGTTWTQLSSYTTTVGAATAFVDVNLILPESFLGLSQVYIRFKYNANWGFYWAIDNVSITGTVNSDVTWSPEVELYLDAEATQAYTGQATSLVYAKGVTNITYTATATNGFGCETSQDIEVVVNSVPTPTGDPVQAITGDTAAFISDIVVVGINVVWYATLQDALNGTNPLDPTTELVDGATYYAVSSDNGCFSEPFAVTVNVTLSSNDIMFQNFNFYPNPVKEILYLSNNEPIISAKVINLIGQEIMFVPINANQGEVNLSSLPHGSYLVQVQVDQFTKIVKVIKN